MTAPATPAPTSFIFDPNRVVDPYSVGIPIIRDRVSYTDKHGTHAVLTRMVNVKSGLPWYVISYHPDRAEADRELRAKQGDIEWYITHEYDREEQVDLPEGAWLVVL
jgi:hypothetical protein